MVQRNRSQEIIIVGAGVAGLTCARRLAALGHHVSVYEASDAAGGRVRTDPLEGFQLDRGFQVLLTAYPNARAELDFDRLELHSFEPGALVRHDGRFLKIVDPWRRPPRFLRHAFAPWASLSDKWKIALLRHRLRRKQLGDILIQPERSTLEELHRLGFSSKIIECFFRPFFRGIFLEPDLATSHRMFEFVFAMFSSGYATLPKAGMQAIPDQIAQDLPPGSLLLQTPVQSVSKHEVTLADGATHGADAVVVATDGATASRMLGDSLPHSSHGVNCVYFAAAEPPIKEPMLILNAEDGPVNHLCFPSQIVSQYAPRGQTLVSVTVLRNESNLETKIRHQLRGWFGKQVDDWRLLRHYEIPYALPSMVLPNSEHVVKSPNHVSGVFLCGDHCDTSSLNGAIASGCRAAESVQLHCGEMARH